MDVLGKITPLAIVNPVRVAGSVISKCTLHNFDYVSTLDIREGDTVKIRKAGDVIPEVASVVISKRREDAVKVVAPTVCPVCGEILEKIEGEVDIRCTNTECEAQIYRAITHFVSRPCMDISQMGEALIEDLIANSLISDVADIYYLQYEDIKSLEGYQDKSAKNIINSILKSKENTLDKLIFGLGIRHVGAKAAKTLAYTVNNIQDLYTMTVEDLTAIEDIGPKIAESIVAFFAREKTKTIIEKLQNAGVNLKGMKKVLDSDKLLGKTFCITGSFDEMGRDEIVKIIENNAGKVSSSVSKKTTYLIYGENAGSKLDKAKTLGVTLLTLDEFMSMV